MWQEAHPALAPVLIGSITGTSPTKRSCESPLLGCLPYIVLGCVNTPATCCCSSGMSWTWWICVLGTCTF